MEWLLFRAARSQKNGNVTEVGTSEVIMGRATRREYQKNSREFDGWVKANTVFGLILAIGILAMALPGLYSAGRPDAAIELSRVTRSFGAPTTAEAESRTAEAESIKNLPVQKSTTCHSSFPAMIDLAPASFQQLDL
jgi:heme/copper-type cytochrome/quinol oxidase subunit 1